MYRTGSLTVAALIRAYNAEGCISAASVSERAIYGAPLEHQTIPCDNCSEKLRLDEQWTEPPERVPHLR